MPAANGGGGSPGVGGGMPGVGGATPATGGTAGAGGTMGNATGGVDTGTGGGGGAATGGSGGSGGAAVSDPTDYKCTRVVGPSQANEWYEHEEGGMSYFETLVPNDKWELKAQSGAQTWKWEDPNQSIWSDDAGGIPIYSRCVGNTPPDRIVAYHVCYRYENRADWDAGLAGFIANIKAKYPTVKRIDLFTGNRCNLDPACSEAAQVTPPTNTCYIFPYIDDAFAAAAAANPGFVFVGPKFERPCAEFAKPAESGHIKQGAPQAAIAKLYADYYNGL